MNEAALEAITSRRSVRAFLPRPVPREALLRILDTAARAPSGSNIQPWKLHALTGAALARLCDRLSAAHAAGEAPRREYQYYPRQWRSPYLERRRAVGWKLYELAGVQRGDREGGMRQEGLNYRFFGAPVGLIFTIDRDMEQGSWLDYGMFLQSVMVAARGLGLDTCPQAAFANYPHLLREELGIPEAEMVVCGMALGWADPEAAVNRLVSEREPATAFTTFHEA